MSWGDSDGTMMLDRPDATGADRPETFLSGVSWPIVFAYLGGGLSAFLGASVLIGWHAENLILIQVSPMFVPMQYNTALGFLLGGVGLIFATRDIRGASLGCGALVAAIGLLTLAEYVFGADLGIDQLLMEHYVTFKTSHPGRMAPNTALCFSLTGLALARPGLAAEHWKSPMAKGVLGSLIIGLGLVALTGYAVRIETAYGWGELTRMAVHTALGLVVLGLGFVSLAWHLDRDDLRRLRSWFPVSMGLGVLTVTICIWQAHYANRVAIANGSGIRDLSAYIGEAILVFGLVLAALLAVAVHLALTARNRAKLIAITATELEATGEELRRAHDELEPKVAERTRELSASKKEAEEASHAKSAFLSSMSHELRTPLNAILGFAQLLNEFSDRPLTEEQESHVAHILDGGRHLLVLINEVLDLSRVEAGELSLSLEAVQVEGAIQQTVALVQPIADEHDITVSIDTKEYSGLDVSADASRLKQVLLNVMTNAVKYNRKNGKVTVRVDLSDEGMARISVEDTGPGIREEDHEEVFQPFSRLGMEGSGIEGTGIGMTISRQLVESMGGSLDFHSEIGQGSTFWLELPVADYNGPEAI